MQDLDAPSFQTTLIADRIAELRKNQREPGRSVFIVRALTPKGSEVRCGNGRGCEGRLGKVVGVWLDPGRGWEYLGGDPVSLSDLGPIYFGEIGLVNGTWLPRKFALHRWHRAYQQASRPSASREFRRRLKQEGLAPFARPDPAFGYDWDPDEEDFFAPPGAQIANAAALPLYVVCYFCFAVNEVAR